MQGKEKNKIKGVILLLSVLLAVSLLLLVGTLLYNHFTQSQPASMKVPDNIITPEKDESATEQKDTSSASASQAASRTASDTRSSEEIAAKAISLHNRNPEDNTPFSVGNMFPGDSETKYYGVRVFHKGDVILRFHAKVRPGHEKLAEVLCCRVVLPESGELLYDGLMRDMPESLNHALRTSTRTTSNVYYEITAYLDTSVGNEYMDKDLIADFSWWVEETENLDSPQTGDSFNIYLWICLSVGSLFLLILLGRRHKKGGRGQ